MTDLTPDAAHIFDKARANTDVKTVSDYIVYADKVIRELVDENNQLRDRMAVRWRPRRD